MPVLKEELKAWAAEHAGWRRDSAGLVPRRGPEVGARFWGVQHVA